MFGVGGADGGRVAGGIEFLSRRESTMFGLEGGRGISTNHDDVDAALHRLEFSAS